MWSRLDPQASCFIPAIQLTTLIQELRPPMGVKGEEGVRAKTQGIIMNVDITLRKGKARATGAVCAHATRSCVQTAACLRWHVQLHFREQGVAGGSALLCVDIRSKPRCWG